MDVVGGPATPSSLCDDQSDLVRVIFSRLNSVDQLANDQNSGVTGIIVNIFLPCVNNGAAGIFQHIHLISLIAKNTDDHGKVIGKHLGDQKGVLLFHFLRKKEPPGFIIY
jgi:hypothetical protein